MLVVNVTVTSPGSEALTGCLQQEENFKYFFPAINNSILQGMKKLPRVGEVFGSLYKRLWWFCAIGCAHSWAVQLF